MTVALEHDRLSVRPSGERPGFEDARVAPEPHRSSLVTDVALLRQKVDHRMGREGVELRGVRVVRAEGGTRKLDDHTLHAHAEPECGNAALAAEAGRLDLPLDAAVAKAAGDDDAIEPDERLDVIGPLEVLAVDPLHLHVAACRPRGMAHGLGDREVRVGQLDVLADEADGQRYARSADSLGERLPFAQVRLAGAREAKLLDDDLPEASVLEHERHAVDGPG